ncbi:rod-determining factor RdfA [Haloarchaeobius amylolyticus]|uniref:rod-determining factor RdfA n=1 Tax=Haloarchaeobius amylolyticus TaxID=1198296 RepID=UPI00226DD60C|nr:rod-determining factor RdfA [Haloarchaeobius amylolyticus]
MSDPTSDGANEPTNKVDRVIQKYDLGDVGDELERLWLGDGDEKRSVRDLADLFNKRILQSAIDASDVVTLGENIDHVYNALTGEESDQTLVRARLEQNGVDVEGVENDFVSHQTIYRYLKNHRDAEQPEPSDEERVEKAEQTIQRLRGRTTAVTERSLEGLQKNDAITLGSFNVLNDIQVLCEDCGRSYDVTDLLERGGCACESE